ncbi:MAG: stage II sporulation protein M [Spirochaetes bacterium]|nr:stage II sporulation protein M [Spirochaetota bacterium]
MDKKEYQFIQQNKNNWDQLENILKKKKKSFSEIELLGQLYLKATENLSFAQTHLQGSNTLVYLNQLVRKCHLIFHRKSTSHIMKILKFLTLGIPETLYSIRYAILTSFLIFSLAITLSFFLVMENTELAEMFVDSRTYEMIRSDLEFKEQFGNFDNIPEDSRIILSLFLWYNNSRVAITVFAFGITLGIGSVLVLIINGFMLGALLAIYYMNGYFADFTSLIMVHGSIELTAIVIAGGAAFHLAASVINPGRTKRVNKLVESGKKALNVIIGVVVFLLWAGLVEGLITPMKLPVDTRFTIAGLNIFILILYLTIGIVISKSKKRQRN